MNKRQRKKLYKQTLIKVKKLHPQKGDVICLLPNLEEIDAYTAVKYFNACRENKVFGEAVVIMLPCQLKQLDKDNLYKTYKHIEKLLKEGE